ncbi:MAG: hypothetical protein BGO67_06305 [Alphaproteobacteria bacterium 41-28]|nr:MAG: hypothetical protein BGO67_06305 [Alphaproteobacteria bacterium 41-28]
MYKLIYSAFLISLIASSASIAMEGNEKDESETVRLLPVEKENKSEDIDWFLHPSPNSQIEKPDELADMIKEYREKGKPIGLAWACHRDEMPKKIRKVFKSKTSPIENWISLDIQDCHIRMDARNEQHVVQVCNWLKENGIEVSTVAFTAFGLDVNTPSWLSVYSVVKKGGLLIDPTYFPTYHRNPSADYSEFGDIFLGYNDTMDISYGNHFYQDVQNYHVTGGKFYQNQEALIASTMDWIEEKARHKGEAGKRLAAKVYANRVVSFKAELVSQWLPFIQNADVLNEDASQLFSKRPEDFTRDYISYYREFMTEIGFDSSSYKVYSGNKADIYGVTKYVYPEDGTYSRIGYGGNISLVVTKQ